MSTEEGTNSNSDGPATTPVIKNTTNNVSPTNHNKDNETITTNSLTLHKIKQGLDYEKQKEELDNLVNLIKPTDVSGPITTAEVIKPKEYNQSFVTSDEVAAITTDTPTTTTNNEVNMTNTTHHSNSDDIGSTQMVSKNNNCDIATASAATTTSNVETEDPTTTTTALTTTKNEIVTNTDRTKMHEPLSKRPRIDDTICLLTAVIEDKNCDTNINVVAKDVVTTNTINLEATNTDDRDEINNSSETKFQESFLKYKSEDNGSTTVIKNNFFDPTSTSNIITTTTTKIEVDGYACKNHTNPQQKLYENVMNPSCTEDSDSITEVIENKIDATNAVNFVTNEVLINLNEGDIATINNRAKSQEPLLKNIEEEIVSSLLADTVVNGVLLPEGRESKIVECNENTVIPVKHTVESAIVKEEEQHSSTVHRQGCPQIVVPILPGPGVRTSFAPISMLATQTLSNTATSILEEPTPQLFPTDTKPEKVKNNEEIKMPTQEVGESRANAYLENTTVYVGKDVNMQEEQHQQQSLLKQIHGHRAIATTIKGEIKKPIKLTYTDVLYVPDPAKDTRRNRGGVIEAFPEKLHRMLSETEVHPHHSSIVSFFSHGRAFGIHKPTLFVTEIMPIYFRQTRFTSFQRQLNLYGFHRITHGPDNGGYFHELFLRGRAGLVVNMRRTKIKGKVKCKHDPDTEPNFYKMPPCPWVSPLPTQNTNSATEYNHYYHNYLMQSQQSGANTCNISRPTYMEQTSTSSTQVHMSNTEHAPSITHPYTTNAPSKYELQDASQKHNTSNFEAPPLTTPSLIITPTNHSQSSPPPCRKTPTDCESFCTV